MAGTNRETAYDLAQFASALKEKPHAFGFFSALRLMECLYADRPRFGTSQRPVDDPLRIGQEPSTAFETACLTAFEPSKGEQPHRLTVRMLGLLGPNGPLPLHLTEYARQRLDQFNDGTFVGFLDMFHHRMLSLFYRAWANNEPTVSFDRPDTDRFSMYVGAMAGLGMPTLRKRDDISDLTKLYYVGRLSCQTRSAEGLQDILSDYFQLPVCVEPFIDEWLTLPDQNICRLGADPINGTLGRSVVVGSRVRTCQHKFRIAMGPLNLEYYESFLPVGNRIRRLIALVRNYIGDELAWDLQLVLKQNEVPAMRLDGKTRLGWTTWLGKRTTAKDADNLIINIYALFIQNHKDWKSDGNKP